MSDGHEKKQIEAVYVTLDPEEFNRVCQRVNELLLARVERAYEKKCKRPTEKAEENYIEASKDAFAFYHLTELIEHMSDEIFALREELGDEPEDIEDIVAAPKGKVYFN